MKEIKLSPKENDLLVPLIETELYQKGLMPLFAYIGNGIAKDTAENAPDWDAVQRNRGKLEMLRYLHKFFKQLNKDSNKK